MRVFADSNVVVSSFTSNGVSRKLIDLLSAEHEIVLSPQVIEESHRIITSKFEVNRQDLEDFERALRANSIICMPPYQRQFDVRDPDDIDILAAALKAKADVLVTGDKDLLDIPNPPLPIVRPRQLYDQLTKK